MSEILNEIRENEWKTLAEIAWTARGNACILGPTKVGAAVLCEDGRVFGGCNVEHRYRCHDVHAEVNAITNMISSGGKKLKAILIVAERNMFTPCGGCMDWIFQFGGSGCMVGFQADHNNEIKKYSAMELMPFYPN